MRHWNCSMIWGPSLEIHQWKKIFQGPGCQGHHIVVVAPGQALKNTGALLVTCSDLGADPDIIVHGPWRPDSWWQASYWGPWWISSWYRACSLFVKQMMCQADSSIRLATWSTHTPWSIISHSKSKSSRLFNTCQYGQQGLVVGVSVKVAQPARCFVGNDCCDRGFEILAMGLVELYGLEVTGTGGSPINGYDSKVVSANMGHCSLLVGANRWAMAPIELLFSFSQQWWKYGGPGKAVRSIRTKVS